MRWTRKVCLLAVAVVMIGAGAARAYDYLVRPVPPRLEKDAATTFLADFSKPTQTAVFAAGEASLGAMAGKFVAEGGYRGSISVAVPGNFPSQAWTVEMILRLPQDATSEARIPLFGWRAENNYTVELNLNNSSGAAFTLSGAARSAGRTYPFHAAGHAGGNGFSVHRNAVGEWIYAACGVDFANRRVALIRRDMNGNVLKRNMEFSGNAQLTTDFLKDIAEAERANAVSRCWTEMGQSFAKGLPPRLVFGNPAMEVRQLRLSNTFREDVLVPAPQWDEGDTLAWTADQIAPGRAKVQTVARQLGYPGYNNERSINIQEGNVVLAPGSEPVVLNLKDMKIGIYSFYLYGSIDPQGRQRLERVWKPCPVEFQAFDANGKLVEIGRRLMKQSFTPRRMQGFHLHVNEPGSYTLKFQILPTAQETARLARIVMIDHLAGLPDEPIKKTQNLAEGKGGRLPVLTEERKKRDDMIWAALPSANLQLQVHAQVKDFLTPPAAANLPTWETKAFSGLPGHSRPGAAFAPLDMINPKTKEVLTHDQVVKGVPWSGPHADDGTGIYLTKAEFPELQHDIYVTPRANLLGERVYIFLGLLGTWDWRGYGLPKKYFEQGAPGIGHDAAMALVRLAYDWPALEMNLHEQRLATHSPDFEFNTDWSSRRNGKYFYDGWSASMAEDLMTDYDQLFPYIKDNQVFADAVHRFIPWIKTPDDVVRFLDRWLVFSSVRENSGKRGTIRGMSEELAGQVLGVHPSTATLFDLTRQFVQIYPFSGPYQELYATALSRSGCYYIGSFMVYALGAAAETVNKAHTLSEAKKMGAPTTMDLSDVQTYRKVKKAGDFMLDMWVAGGFPFMVGDASGGPHTGPVAAQKLKVMADTSRRAVDLWGDKRHAWLLKNVAGISTPEIDKLAADVKSPIVHNPSRVVPDYGAILEQEVAETDLTLKTAATLRLGIAQGHAHNDYLDLNLFGMGLPLAVDLACRNEGDNWSRPGAAWSFLHNHAIAHGMGERGAQPPLALGGANPAGCGNQNGEPWLTTFAPPLLRASYTTGRDEARLDRDVLLMQIGDTPNYYAFDLQRLKGDKIHTWCFHGCESDDLQINVPMEEKTVRWIDRTLIGSHKVGSANTDTLQAVWTMTREAKDYKHDFNKGGVIKTVACEQAVLGARYDAAQPPVHVRATLLGCKGDLVMQGKPFSQSYGYAFPFLWSQRLAPAEGSVFPAVYEWYRGDKPWVTKTEWTERGATNTVKVSLLNGQEDTYTVTPETFAALSRDAKGLRWAKLSGLAAFDRDGLRIKAATSCYRTTIAEIDYRKGALTTKEPLPANPGVSIGNPLRQTWLDLKGEGTTFTFADDLIVHEGALTDLKITGDTADIQSSQRLFREGEGNRKMAGFTQTNEDGSWQFRGGKVIRKPQGGTLTREVFTDANKDGFVNVKTYEVGIGDGISLPADITVRRTDNGYEVKTNVAVEGSVAGKAFNLKPSLDWQRM